MHADEADEEEMKRQAADRHGKRMSEGTPHARARERE